MKNGGATLIPNEPVIDDGGGPTTVENPPVDDGSNRLPPPGMSPVPPTTSLPPDDGVPPGSTPPPNIIPVKRLCSNRGTESSNTNVLESSKLELYIVKGKAQNIDIGAAKAAGDVVCSYSKPGVREQLTTNHALNLALCVNVQEGASYTMVLIDPDKPVSGSSYANLLTVKGSASQVKIQDRKLVVSSKNGGTSALMALFDVNTPNATSDDEDCDKRASPLVINLASDVHRPEPIDLTSPIDGILFDILGGRAKPYAHAKNQISWITNAGQYRFLVKPNGFGDVNGIDELFGDNTLGPDGRYAKNGFAALAKYDSNRDGAIDARDPVFSQLRLWSDFDFDGVSTKSELITLSEAGISSISLRADPRYAEQDAYGNLTTLKSLVDFNDGSRRLIFDVWFNIGE